MRTRIKGAWDWFTGLRWWWKTLLVAPVALAAFVGLYVFARGVQYSSVTGSAAAYLPASADLSLGVFDLEGEWARLQDSSFWKKIDKKVLKDRTTRALLNERLKEADLPTVDQWKDDRWLADNPFFTEEMILRGAGRDVMAALRVGASFQKARMVAATKVTFGDYLLLPFAGLAGSFIGAGSESIPENRAGKRDVVRRHRRRVRHRERRQGSPAGRNEKEGEAAQGDGPLLVEGRF